MLTLVSHPLPVAWDGRAVTWTSWERQMVVQICPPPREEQCGCGSAERPFTSRGLRDPEPESVTHAASLPRIGRRTRLVWPVYDLHAFRCPGCGEVTVWDMASDEWWTLDESDYGTHGSVAPAEWSGGLFDLLGAP